MQYHLMYHNGLRPITIPEKAKATVLQPAAIPSGQPLPDMLTEALEDVRFGEQLRASAPTSIAIAVPDGTQPFPTMDILPTLLQKLFKELPSIEPAHVNIIVADGSHAHPPCKTIQNLLELDLPRTCNLVSHDAHNAPMRHFGVTRRGTPVSVNDAFGKSAFKMVLGIIEPHLFYGISDALKTAVMGCASIESIRQNHRLMKAGRACVGKLGGNPMREDLTEAGRILGIDFGVNVVMNSDGDAVAVLAGEPEGLLERGADACAVIFGVELAKKYDIILASCADDQKDITASQALKSFNRISHVVKKGGKILLLVASRKGFGEDLYFDYVCPFADPELISEELYALGFTMGDRSADRFGATIVKSTTDELDDLDAHIMKHCHLRAADPSTVLEEWVDDYDGIPEVAVIPYAMTTFFYNK